MFSIRNDGSSHSGITTYVSRSSLHEQVLSSHAAKVSKVRGEREQVHLSITAAAAAETRVKTEKYSHAVEKSCALGSGRSGFGGGNSTKQNDPRQIQGFTI